VRTGFLALARDEPARWRIIDAAQSEEAVAREVLAVVLERLSPAPGRQ